MSALITHQQPPRTSRKDIWSTHHQIHRKSLFSTYQMEQSWAPILQGRHHKYSQYHMQAQSFSPDQGHSPQTQSQRLHRNQTTSKTRLSKLLQMPHMWWKRHRLWPHPLWLPLRKIYTNTLNWSYKTSAQNTDPNLLTKHSSAQAHPNATNASTRNQIWLTPPHSRHKVCTTQQLSQKWIYTNQD